MNKSLIILLAFLVTSCGDPVSQPKGMLAEELNCPEGSQPQIERWGGVGENGWLHTCKMKHGTFTTWRGETQAIEGNYVMGKKEGLWLFWNKEGNKYKEVTYKDGKEVKVENFK